MDINDISQVLIIMGRLFLATAGVLIDVLANKISFSNMRGEG